MNSALNPEAPEFYPHLTTVTQEGYTTVNKTIRSSNRMPSGVSYRFFKTYTDFNILTCQLSKNVVAQTNQIVVAEAPGVKLKCKDDEYNTEKIIDASDDILDRVYINIDTLTGVNRPSEKFLAGLAPSVNVASWNKNPQPVIAKIKVGTTTFIGAKNIPRPQLTFKDTIDNSESLWVPKISDKPNSIKPLALKILYNEEGEAVGYEHPYLMELEMYEPPDWALEGGDGEAEGGEEPPPLEQTPLTLVESEAQLDSLLQHLLAVREFAVDLEHHAYRTYQGITCLIQITTEEGGDFIIDALAVREHIHKLNLVFTDPKKVKVFHGAEQDVLWLQRDFGVYVVGMFDTFLAAKMLQLKGLSLKHLLMQYCGVDADKTYQLADWRIRPLPEELIQYARSDTHYLLFVWRRLRAQLRDSGLNLLRAVFSQARLLCGKTYNKEFIHEESHLRIYARSRKSFNAQQMAALQLLYKWRDAEARQLDESTAYLVPNHMVVALADALPRDVQGVVACCDPMPPFVKQNLLTIHRMILACREVPLEAPPLVPRETAAGARGRRTTVAHMLDDPHPHDLKRLSYPREEPVPPPREAPAEAPANTDVPAFIRPPKDSKLNVYAEQYVPPYHRYKLYRTVQQEKDIKDLEEREARIKALCKGNELIKTEVLLKVQQAKLAIEQESVYGKPAADAERGGGRVKEEPDEGGQADADVKAEPGQEGAGQEDAGGQEGAGKKRKRKMHSEKADAERKQAAAGAGGDELKRKPGNKNDKNKTIKPFLYKNVNYRKFYDDSDKALKQPKTKFKKHK